MARDRSVRVSELRCLEATVVVLCIAGLVFFQFTLFPVYPTFFMSSNPLLSGRRKFATMASKYCFIHLFFQRSARRNDEGTFIEIGIGNGLDNSDSFFFEKSLFWHGICIEPNKAKYAQLEYYRPECDNYRQIPEPNATLPQLILNSKNFVAYYGLHIEYLSIKLVNKLEFEYIQQINLDKIVIDVIQVPVRAHSTDELMTPHLLNCGYKVHAWNVDNSRIFVREDFVPIEPDDDIQIVRAEMQP